MCGYDNSSIINLYYLFIFRYKCTRNFDLILLNIQIDPDLLLDLFCRILCIYSNNSSEIQMKVASKQTTKN